MFGECFDFAPVPTRGQRRQYLAPVQLQHQPTPKEQANRLAASAGIDPTLLDGISNKLLEGLKVADIRAGMQYACSALQQGKVVTDLSETSVGDFLVAKIARLPLGTRFPLMAEWTARMPAAWSSAQTAPKAVPLEGNFVSFGEGGGGGDAPAASVRHAEEGKKKKEKKRKPVQVQESYEDEDMGQVEIHPDPVVKRSQPAAPVETGKAVFEEISVDNEQMRREAARREEEAKNTASKVLINLQQTKAAVEAGLRAARQSSQISSDHKSKDDGDKGLNRQRRARGDTLEQEEQSQEFDEYTKEAPQSRSCSRSRQGHSRRNVEHDQEGRCDRDRRARGHPDDQDRRPHAYDDRYDRRRRRGRDIDYEAQGGRSQRYDRRDRESYHDDSGRRSGRAQEYQVHDDSRSRSYDGGGRRPYTADSFRHADSRSCSRDGRGTGSQYSRDRRGNRSEAQDGSARMADSHEAGGKQEADPANKRKKHLMDLFRGMRSESPEREGQRRKAEAIQNEKKQASGEQRGSHSRAVARAFDLSGNPSGIDEKRASKTPVSSVPKAPATQEAAKAPEKKEPKLRQLAFKNGWAEYVEEGTGQHVYKNVFTGEMTKTKPAELAPQITEAQNMRRLQWLSTHRQAQMMGDMALMGGHLPPM